MRKILLGVVTMTGLFVLTTFGASAAQSNSSAIMRATPAYGVATDVYYHRHWHHWRRWHHRHHWY
jgi:hypothetical protein